MLTLNQTAATNGQFQFQFNADSNLTFTNAMTNAARLYRIRTP